MLVKFTVFNDGEFWCARGIDADIFTQGKTLDELYKDVREAVGLHFEDLLAKGEKVQVLVIWEIEVPRIAAATSN